MPESKDKSHFSEMIGGFIALAGVVLGAIRWWSGDTFWNSAGLMVVFLLTGGMIILLAEGLRTGKLGIRGGYVYQDKNPIVFWVFVVFYVLVCIAFAVMSVVYMLI